MLAGDATGQQIKRVAHTRPAAYGREKTKADLVRGNHHLDGKCNRKSGYGVAFARLDLRMIILSPGKGNAKRSARTTYHSRKKKVKLDHPALMGGGNAS